MMYLKKISTKTKKIIYMLVVYNPSDVTSLQKIFISEDVALLLIEKYNLEVK